MENYSLLMGAAALMKMAVVSMEKPSGGTSPSRRRAGTETPVPQILASRWRRLWKVSRTVAYSPRGFRIEFFLKEPIGFSCWRYFYVHHLGAATKLLDDMMINYSEWHTERTPQGKKVNSVEETSSLGDKIDAIMSMLANGRSHIDPNNVPLASLVAQEENVDVNFIKSNNFNNNAYRNNYGNNNYRPYPSNNGSGYGNSYGNSYNNNKSVPSGLEVMLKEFISTQTAFNKTVEEKLGKIDVLASKVDSLALDVDLLKLKVMPEEVKDARFAKTNAIQVRINDNIRMLAELHARWDREEKEKLAKENNVAKVWTITTTSNVDSSHVATPPTINGKIIGVGNVSTPSAKRAKLPETACDKTAEIFQNIGDNDSIAVEHNGLDFDDCHITEVIKFLQKLARSPNASAINLAFTKHITNALIKAREEKLKLEASIPRKLEDGWEPIIKMKFNDFECNALCDLGASISVMPKKIYDMLDLPPLKNCYLDVNLADNVKKKPLGRIDNVRITVNNNLVPVDFVVLDIECNASCPIVLGRPFLRTVGAVIDMKEGLNFSSRNLLDSAAGGTFMSITLGAATKLLDDMMINYSEWHTERTPQGKKVNSVEETSSLGDKIDAIMSMLANGRSHIDPNNVPLDSLVAQEENVDVNFIKNNNFNNNAYRNNYGNNNYRPYPSNNGNGYGNSYNNNKSVPSGLEVMLKEFISTQTAFNKTVEEKLDKIDILASKVDSLALDVDILKLKVMPEKVEDARFAKTNAIQVRINDNIRLLAELHARWDREEKEKLAKENNVAKVWTITTTSNVDSSHVAAPPTINGKIIGVGNVSTPSAKRTKLPETAVCDKTAEIFQNIGDNDSIAVEHNGLDFDDCHITEVIKFLQKLARSPNASAINLAFTKHITNALIKAREEKLKLEASIPRKLEDGWEPIIKMKFNDFECNALCDLGASISVMPKKIYDMLDLPPLKNCYLDVNLADNVKKKPLGRIDNVRITVNNNLVPVYFVVLDIECNASCPIVLGRPFLRTVGAVIDMKEELDEDIPTSLLPPSLPTEDEPAVKLKSNEVRIGPMTRARAKLLKQQVNLFLNDTLIDENFILPKSYYLCIIRYQETSIARGGEEQLDVKMDVKLDMELDMKKSHGRAREEREDCARGEEEVQAGPAPGQTGPHAGLPGCSTRSTGPLTAHPVPGPVDAASYRAPTGRFLRRFRLQPRSTGPQTGPPGHQPG
ncbi:hypothetical protein QYE76_010548 [Lolium multiflorum]|uniref:Reverse transcriptase domain-containing protein n=1 Tax=Lolium multiflorum TaxID=4521 RepID=A0AAD8TV83_LOLMU|nr:hypothetical protein QYE76_010548 [Lolium multiflorum]